MEKVGIKKLWSDTRTKSIIILLLWIVGFSICFGLVALYNKVNPPKIEEEIKNSENIKMYTFLEKIENTINKDYYFQYEVTVQDTMYIFNGTKKAENTIGYKESQEEIIKYKESNDTVTRLYLQEEVPYDNLYDGINREYLNLENIKELVVTALVIPYENDYEVHIEDVKFLFISNEEYITDIEIETLKDIYKIHYKFL